MIPAMIVFAILSGALLGLPDPLVTRAQGRHLPQLQDQRRAGRSRSWSSRRLSAFLHLVVIAVIITLTAPLLFKAPLPVNWGGFALVFVAGGVRPAPGSSLLIGVISSSSQMTVLLSQLIFLPSMILGGLMMPTSMLPAALGKVACSCPPPTL